LTRAIVAGVGMIPFKKPNAGNVYVAMGSEAARRALADAGLAYTNIQQAYVGYVYGDSTCGLRDRSQRSAHHQCQQQLLHGIDGVVSRPPGD
jgi:acetyl-CoA acetyltransferase